MGENQRTWSPYEIDFIRANYRKLSAYEMAAQLQRTVGSVKVQLHRQDISRGDVPQFYLRCPSCGFNRHMSNKTINDNHQPSLRNWVIIQGRKSAGRGQGFQALPQLNQTIPVALRGAFQRQTINVLRNLVRLGREAEQILKEMQG